MAAEPDFVCVYEPFRPEHVAVIHSKLSTTGIHYYITNEHYTGGAGTCDGAMQLMVEAGRAREVRDIILSCEALQDSR